MRNHIDAYSFHANSCRNSYHESSNVVNHFCKVHSAIDLSTWAGAKPQLMLAHNWKSSFTAEVFFTKISPWYPHDSCECNKRKKCTHLSLEWSTALSWSDQTVQTLQNLPFQKNAQQKLKCREPFTRHSFSCSIQSVVMTAPFIDRVAGDPANQYSLYISGLEQNTTSVKRLFRSSSSVCRGDRDIIYLKSNSIFGDKGRWVAARMAKIFGRYLLVLMLLLPTTILFVGQRKSTSLRASCLLLRGSGWTNLGGLSVPLYECCTQNVNSVTVSLLSLKLPKLEMRSENAIFTDCESA